MGTEFCFTEQCPSPKDFTNASALFMLTAMIYKIISHVCVVLRILFPLLRF